MRQGLSIRYADGRQVDTTAGPADFIAFERHFAITALELQFRTKIKTDADDRPLLDEDGDPQVVVDVEEWSSRVHVEWIYYLGWHTLHRTGDESRTFEDFLADVDHVDLIPTRSGVDPTTSTPPSGDSHEQPSDPGSTSTGSPETPTSS